MRHARGLLIAALATAPSVGDAQTWRTLDVSRQLHDTTEHRIRVQYAAGRFSLRPSALDAARYARFADFLLEQGLIEEAIPLSDYTAVVN